MEIYEKAKELLLDHNCLNCKYLETIVLNPYELNEYDYYDEKIKFYPNNLKLRFKCLHLKLFLQMPEKEICKSWSKNKRKPQTYNLLFK